MASIAFLLLAHKAPGRVAAQARLLSARGDHVVVHFDAGADAADWLALVAALAGLPRVHLVTRRQRCGWGEWSLVAATLEMMRAALAAAPGATHLLLLSGDCMPVRPHGALAAHLDSAPRDVIETEDLFRSDWIKTGLRAERVLYRHPFNERRHPRLFARALALQQRAGLERRLPADLPLKIGSQWWCLRRQTAEAVLDFCRTRPEVPRFFRLAWIPDECFFQSVVARLVPGAERTSRLLTRSVFSDYGMPLCFHDDQSAEVLGAEAFFLRKIAPGARGLRQAMARQFLSEVQAPAPPGPDLDRRCQWRAARGREGRASPPPPWDQPLPGLRVIVCKRWHVSARLAARMAGPLGAAAPGADPADRHAARPGLPCRAFGADRAWRGHARSGGVRAGGGGGGARPRPDRRGDPSRAGARRGGAGDGAGA
ncbi:beta-1,6-N-acetylglucosaminyltransferase [Poseidonocella sp. HB161398]|uniref:beta-1,6-N-acetylglucosaminyltransferase n=1 Tax=Poseidonocella sp. HB161398 TaxID=2320855 RepID=UPI001108128B|nr:beta-1,6-N-acetylglucosaminyltransferase [Poseidonocella sp. HB161398]